MACTWVLPSRSKNQAHIHTYRYNNIMAALALNPCYAAIIVYDYLCALKSCSTLLHHHQAAIGGYLHVNGLLSGELDHLLFAIHIKRHLALWLKHGERKRLF